MKSVDKVQESALVQNSAWEIKSTEMMRHDMVAYLHCFSDNANYAKFLVSERLGTTVQAREGYQQVPVASNVDGQGLLNLKYC